MPKSLNSDTESEPECTGPSSSFPKTLGVNTIGPKTILDAVEYIQGIELDLLVQDTSIHEDIAMASATILDFLDDVYRAPLTEKHLHQRLLNFGDLVNLTFLSVLFEHRKIFHRIAAQSIAPESSPSGAVICWVDAILAKLGDATVLIATGSPLELTVPLFPGNTELRMEDNLRAASQMPSDWNSVAGMMASDQSSPAAKRLALRLTFAAFVLGPRVCAEPAKPPTRIPSEMIEVLERCVNQTRTTGFSASLAGDQLAIQERLNFAMIISLFAATDREQRSLAQGLDHQFSLRPHTLGCLLNLIQDVIHPTDSLSSLELTAPPEHLDPAQTILLQWGDTVRWCWETWDDPRIANAESIVYFTSMWLLHSDKHFLPDDVAIQPSSTYDPTAASIAILRVIHHALSSWSPFSGCRPRILLLVVSRACFQSVRLMRHLLSVRREDERWIISGFCKCYFSLFPLLTENDEVEESNTNDYILEALSLLDAVTLRICLSHVQQDSALRFSARVDDCLMRARKTLEDVCIQRTKLQVVRSILNFATIIWFSQTRGCLLRQSISAFLSAAVQLLLDEDPRSLSFKILGDALIIASSASKNDPSFLDEKRDAIWQFAMSSSDLVIVSSFAHYILTSDCLCDSLYCAEAWVYLREILLLILKHHYVEEQEPLALFVCPTVCGALMRLLQAEFSASKRCAYLRCRGTVLT
ncbi:hypothetical protein B0H10DRAFT_1995578 [Mycena sp. CBHHK59/15]|nr:hypothetical protein B0H10DRAFT_1995578 [Mycena sp. CBHHK59/15]